VTSDATPNPLLNTRGHVYVTLAAVRGYMHATDGPEHAIEEARRDLTELLLRARIRREDRPGELVLRVLDRSRNLDVQGRALVEPPFVVVTRVQVRGAITSGERRQRRIVR